MKTTRFDPVSNLIIVGARIGDRLGAWKGRARLAIDTGSSATVLKPELLDRLGYSPRDGEAMTTVRAALGEEHGYTLRITRFAALGYTAVDFRIHVLIWPKGLASTDSSACRSCVSSITRCDQRKG